MAGAALAARAAGAEYAGSAACQPCHAAVFAKQRVTGHARALAKAKAGEWGEWAFGAGSHAVTWVSRVDAEWYVEHGLSYYSATKSTGITPGHADDKGRRYRTLDAEATTLRCFRCHSTGPLRFGAGRAVVPFELGVGCESCHGPGAAHVKAGGGSGSIFNPARLSPEGLNQYCGACHRKAEDIADWSRSWNVRHQPAYLSQSVCFRASEKLTCLTCHDQHGALETRAETYQAKCVSCHGKIRHAAPVTGTCTSCHMPAVRTNANLRFANHWIGVYRAGSNLVPTRRREVLARAAATALGGVVPPADVSLLLPLFEQAAAESPLSARAQTDLGLFLKSAVGASRAVEPLTAAVSLSRAVGGAELPSAMENLASVQAALGNVRAALPLYAEAADGSDAAVASRSFSALAQLDEANAVAHLSKALAKEEVASGKDHPRVALLANNLALALRVKGDNAKAEPLLRRALAAQEKSLGPNHAAVGSTLSNLGSLLEATGRGREAEAALRRAIRIFESRMGPETAELAIACTNLAGIVPPPEAIRLLRRTLRIDEGIYGPSHPEVAGDLENLATLLEETGASRDAHALRERASRIRRAQPR